MTNNRSAKGRGKAKKDVGHGGLDEWFSGHGEGKSKDKGEATWGDWVSISPVKRTLKNEDGSTKKIEPGDIVGPCGISKKKEWKEFTRGGKDPLKCMPRQKAYDMPKKERAEIARGKLRKERKSPNTGKPVNTKTFKKKKKARSVSEIAALHLARKTPFNVDFIKVLRKEFLTLMKNAKVVKNYRQAQAWREAMANWRTRFDELIYKRLSSTISNIPLQYDWVSRDEANKWGKYVRKETWDLYLESRVPVDRADDYWSEEARFQQFQKDLKKWDGRVRRHARKAWKALEGFVSWYKHTTSAVPTVDMPSSEQVNLEGFQVLVKDYDPSFDLNPEFMTRFKVGLKHYKQRAKQVLPLLLQKQVPLVLDFKKDLSAAGTYHGRFIEISPSASEKNPGAMAKILAHEMGHHIWQTYLSKEAQDFWRRTITGNYGTLNLHDVLKRYGSEKDFWENKRIMREDPLLYLQIDGLYSDQEYKNTFAPRSGKAIWTMDDVREYLDNGGRATWRVHGKPITGYAHKNPEEAFCEAIGMLVGYGPRAVLPEVRSWLKVILPQIKVAKMQDSWLEITPDHLYRGEEEEAEEEEGSFDKISPPIDPTPMSLKEAVTKRYLARKDRIPGGLGDKARKKDFDPKQVAKGIKVELEHTKDKAIAEEIALDHLTEDPRYYDKLETIEKHASSSLTFEVGSQPNGGFSVKARSKGTLVGVLYAEKPKSLTEACKKRLSAFSEKQGKALTPLIVGWVNVNTPGEGVGTALYEAAWKEALKRGALLLTASCAGKTVEPGARRIWDKLERRHKLGASSEHEKQIALMKWMSRATQKLGVARHTYVVGGAVRNFVLRKPIKDVDVVIDSVKAGKNSDWLGKQMARLIPAPTDLTTNQYGVAILTVKGDWDVDGNNLKGEVIEIANARSESYGKGDDHGKGYKPTDVQPATIEQDLRRRDFNFNTLMWRLLDLAKGPDKAEILDLTGCGLKDLQEGVIHCPADPDKTFADDPTRMLRLIRFSTKYNMKIPPDVAAAVRRNAHKLKNAPWEAVATILMKALRGQ
jgi:hypothetical protein